ncbi:ribokinase [Frigidibacter sp. ROC022]|uniref:ribokinase n=1 Tax=Frigidibacter sp. ROC022 TaxID=2971796 RepID=UPI00215B1EC1|nr:ribokinase [Frigidibacter sp. ROC022]MCR8725552.1 ribokinase [Frigidibacter sp. ROC022]
MASVVILGIFVADTAYRAPRLPKIGETLLGQGFALGPGGKGSNQAVAAGLASGADGPEVHFITRTGEDDFARLADQVWARAGVRPAVTRDPQAYTGAAFIFVSTETGDNAIIVAPGAAADLGPRDAEAQAGLIGGATVFVTQLEQPLPAARRALELARAGGAVTILNPAPAAALPEGFLALCDWVTPNETEAEALTGIAVTDLASAEAAARALIGQGAGGAVMTLGAQGVLLVDASGARHIPAFSAGAVADTTGAGDAFNGSFALALAEGRPPAEAARFGCAAAGISVTRPGAAAAMPDRAEIDALLRGSAG